MFFGTPHNGSSKTRLLGSLQKLASLALPKATAQFESSLLNALEEDSETLQNIADQFTPLMCNFRIFFFWEQEKTNLRYTKDYIVEETSAAPILDNTERSGIAADHRGMVKFHTNTEQGFRTAVAALRRYCQMAPQVIQGRLIQSAEILSESRRFEAMEMLKDAPVPNRSSMLATPSNIERESKSIGMLENSHYESSEQKPDFRRDDTMLLPIPSLRAI
jgi:hypothetical protein